MKGYGGLRRTLMRGLNRVQLHVSVVAAAYNLMRISPIDEAAARRPAALMLFDVLMGDSKDLRAERRSR